MSGLAALGRSLAGLLFSLLVVGVLWTLALAVLDISPYVAKTPLDVWAYLVTDDEAATNRAEVMSGLGITLLDAFIGFVAGLVVALVTASVFSLFRGVEHALMPMAMLLRSVPLVAMAPIIILVFGRTTATTAAMGALVVFFPALVTIVQGLRSGSRAIVEVVQVYGGDRLAVFRRVALPSALPSLFTALRVSIPGALTGALLAEWLATGQGLGHLIVSSVGRARYDQVWACVVVVTLVSIVLYRVLDGLEHATATAMGAR